VLFLESYSSKVFFFLSTFPSSDEEVRQAVPLSRFPEIFPLFLLVPYALGFSFFYLAGVLFRGFFPFSLFAEASGRIFFFSSSVPLARFCFLVHAGLPISSSGFCVT